MQFRALLFLTLLFLSSNTFSLNNADVFPDIKNWEKSEDTKEYGPANLFDYINGAADSFLSYGFIHIWIKEYTHSSGALIKAEIYEHQDLKYAFGIYSIERASDYEFLDIGGQAYQIEDILNMVCGKYYVKLHGYDLKGENTIALTVLARGLAKNLDKDAHLQGQSQVKKTS